MTLMQFRILKPDRIEPFMQQWEQLFEDAIDHNPFFSPSILIPALQYLAPKDQVKLAIVTNQNDILLALAPVIAQSKRYGFLPSTPTLWRHPYSMIGVPLIQRDSHEEVIKFLLYNLGQEPSLGQVFYLPFLPKKSAFFRSIKKWDCLHNVLKHYQRAILEMTDNGAHYFQNHVSAKNRKKWRQQRKKLETLGNFQHVIARTGDGFTKAIEDFLYLESKGWKGEKGTALSERRGHDRFFQAAMQQWMHKNQARADGFYIDGKPIASLISFGNKKSMAIWKTAYDEDYARYSPGLLVIKAFTEHVLDHQETYHVDSLADPGHTLIERLWRERMELCDVMVDLSPTSSKSKMAFHWAVRMEQLRELIRMKLSKMRA